jgi:hypothetical protein
MKTTLKIGSRHNKNKEITSIKSKEKVVANYKTNYKNPKVINPKSKNP